MKSAHAARFPYYTVNMQIRTIAYGIPKVIILYSTEDIDLLGYSKRPDNE